MTTSTNIPAHSLRLGSLKATIWANPVEGRLFHSVTFARSYTDANHTWHDSSSFGREDLLGLAKLADQAHSWISDQQGRDG
jgi:hypothetical protein